MVKFSSLVFRVLNEKIYREKEKKMTEASALVCPILATALKSLATIFFCFYAFVGDGPHHCCHLIVDFQEVNLT